LFPRASRQKVEFMGLVVSNAQVSSIQAQYDWVVIDDIAAFLMQHCDPGLVTDVQARQIAAHAYQRGRQLGLRKKTGLKLFAFLVAETGGQALHAPEIAAALTQDGISADAAMDEILNVAGLCGSGAA
jgi:hypothetical protein